MPLSEVEYRFCHSFAAASVQEPTDVFSHGPPLFTMQVRMFEVAFDRFDHLCRVIDQPHPSGLRDRFEVRPRVINLLDQFLPWLAGLRIVVEIDHGLIEDCPVQRRRR